MAAIHATLCFVQLALAIAHAYNQRWLSAVGCFAFAYVSFVLARRFRAQYKVEEAACLVFQNHDETDKSS